MSLDICPICKKEVEDMRHVGVECFYDVSEISNKVEESTIFTEVDENTAYWGITRRYKEGTRDSHFIEEQHEEPLKLNDGYETSVKHTKIGINQIPIESIRLLEKSIFSINCCKSCRADFLWIFRSWIDGKLIDLYELKRKFEDEGMSDMTLREFVQSLLKDIP